MKTFMEFLKERREDEFIYVGTEHGSSWIVIETAGKIIESMDKIESIIRDQSERNLAILNEATRIKPRLISNIVESIIEMEGYDDAGDEIEERAVALNKEVKEYTRTLKKWNRYNEIASKYATFGDRPVVKTYAHTSTKPGVSVEVKGYENGTIWFYGEKKII